MSNLSDINCIHEADEDTTRFCSKTQKWEVQCRHCKAYGLYDPFGLFRLP